MSASPPRSSRRSASSSWRRRRSDDPAPNSTSSRAPTRARSGAASSRSRGCSHARVSRSGPAARRSAHSSRPPHPISPSCRAAFLDLRIPLRPRSRSRRCPTCMPSSNSHPFPRRARHDHGRHPALDADHPRGVCRPRRLLGRRLRALPRARRTLPCELRSAACRRDPPRSRDPAAGAHGRDDRDEVAAASGRHDPRDRRDPRPRALVPDRIGGSRAADRRGHDLAPRRNAAVAATPARRDGARTRVRDAVPRLVRAAALVARERPRSARAFAACAGAGPTAVRARGSSGRERPDPVVTLSRRTFLIASSGACVALGGCDPLEVLRGSAPVNGTFVAPTGPGIDLAQHVLGRCTFGLRPGDRGAFLALAPLPRAAAAAWIEQQLAPQEIDDERADRAVRRWDWLDAPIGELYEYKPQVLLRELTAAALLRATLSKRQLYEVLVEFWTDHFNIDSSKGECAWLKAGDDREVIRKHAFGRFPELLRASASSPAMLWYLDGRANVKRTAVERPNENYARELLELHTLGVHGGYTQQDVMEAARCLTGWTVRDKNGFRKAMLAFHVDEHDNGR